MKLYFCLNLHHFVLLILCIQYTSSFSFHSINQGEIHVQDPFLAKIYSEKHLTKDILVQNKLAENESILTQMKATEIPSKSNSTLSTYNTSVFDEKKIISKAELEANLQTIKKPNTKEIEQKASTPTLMSKRESDLIKSIALKNNLKLQEEQLSKYKKFDNFNEKSIIPSKLSIPKPVPKVKSSQELEGSFKISYLYTKISIKENSPNAVVNEQVTYELRGSLKKILRKISLSGTGISYSSFKLISYDLKLLRADVTKNCLETSTEVSHPYICVEANFEEIDTGKKPMTVTIEYEYTVRDIIRKRKIPFKNNNEQENIIVWIIDNNKMNTSIENASLKIDFNRKFDNSLNVLAYPEKFLVKHPKIKTKENKWSAIEWKMNNIKANEIKNFAINIPIFLSECRNVIELEFHFFKFTWARFCFWLLLALIGVIVIVFLSAKMKKEHYDHDVTTIGENPSITQSASPEFSKLSNSDRVERSRSTSNIVVLKK